jgi:hypothetical protein
MHLVKLKYQNKLGGGSVQVNMVIFLYPFSVSKVHVNP